jgi:hypothetical protein
MTDTKLTAEALSIDLIVLGVAPGQVLKQYFAIVDGDCSYFNLSTWPMEVKIMSRRRPNEY